MILIADNGSTSINWVCVSEEGKKIEFVDEGFNPNYHNIELFKNYLKKLKSERDIYPKEIFFYSTGAGNFYAKEQLTIALQKAFVNSEIFVETDLTGAARATFKRGEGIAAILGTGANAGCYNGSEIINQPKSLGYIMGDEGSGAYIGKLFLKTLLENRFSEDLTSLLLKEIGLCIDDILPKIYRSSKPAFYLASFMPLLKKYIANQQIHSLVTEAFQYFFDNIVSRIGDKSHKNIAFAGSVAYHFSSQLKEVCSANGFVVHSITNHPINGLLEYHTGLG
ncbi:MAG: hypothetical protein U9R32_07310 [Bacteroidota bacterium]|nr:hypothetical protein [Bacteroidota bacterium]